MPTITWKPPSIPGAATFAEWDGATFALVTQLGDGRWRVCIFPDGQSHLGRNGYARDEAEARLWVRQWAKRNHARIRPAPGRQIMPHEGIKPRKPKGLEDRS